MERTVSKVAQPAICDAALLAAVELVDVLLAEYPESGLIDGAAAQQLAEDQLRQVWGELADVKRMDVSGDAARCYNQQ